MNETPPEPVEVEESKSYVPGDILTHEEYVELVENKTLAFLGEFEFPAIGVKPGELFIICYPIDHPTFRQFEVVEYIEEFKPYRPKFTNGKEKGCLDPDVVLVFRGE